MGDNLLVMFCNYGHDQRRQQSKFGRKKAGSKNGSEIGSRQAAAAAMAARGTDRDPAKIRFQLNFSGKVLVIMILCIFILFCNGRQWAPMGARQEQLRPAARSEVRGSERLSPVTEVDSALRPELLYL